MSGTSLDGIDIAACSFSHVNDKVNFKLHAAKTIEYQCEFKEKLRKAHALSGENLVLLDAELGKLIGSAISKFIQDFNISNIAAIGSHGHTVFHRPDKNISFQIGNPAIIKAITNLKVVSSFRSLDTALGGQGAPLVPIGDKLLFYNYDACLNLGGFSNISYEKNNKRVAYDICPVNIVLNKFAARMGFEYDNNGNIARGGKLIPELLNSLNSLKFYSLKPPKSLGREWLESTFNPITEKYNKFETSDILATLTEHTAIQISKVVADKKSVLTTGGGALNKFLIEKIIEHSNNNNLVIPKKDIVNFKEAIVFALLAFLRLNNINNCLSSVTGASKDSSGGLII